MPRAWCLIREQVHYRREAFLQGLTAAGYEIIQSSREEGNPNFSGSGAGDVLVIWNRYGHYEDWAGGFERRGGTVLVAENGYLGDDVNGRQHYALAIGQHNGGGRWHVGGPERWRALGVALKPWRERGEHVLICPQRGIGPRDYAQRADWPHRLADRLKGITRRSVRVRPHPGNVSQAEARASLARDLEGCWAVVTWASGAGIHALVAGVPVFYEAPYWILSGAGEKNVLDIDNPHYLDRETAFVGLAWAQWTVEEIASGEPFKHLKEGVGEEITAAQMQTLAVPESSLSGSKLDDH